MGTSAFAVPAMRRLLDLGHVVPAVYTQPPRPAGRGQVPRRTPMHDAAEAMGLPVETPQTLKDPEVQRRFAAFGADLAVVGAYGLLLPQAILDAPRLGCINLHASLLPRWRGAAPIERAILADDHETGLAIFRMERGLDTGPVLAMRPTPIGDDDTAWTLHARLAEMAAEMLPGVVDDLLAGRAEARPQPEAGVTYATKLDKAEGRIDFGQPADMVARRLRALNPRPGCWCLARGERLSLIEGAAVDGRGDPGAVIGLPLTVACGSGALRLERVQRSGRKAMSAEELQRGFALPVGSVLG
ncbi:MAG TPA: methionyl-tRNA formyltransferase [Geminicoccaceae bacterium]|nr:methionyl-tRNA formyltransferase [Geminicoccus sp.]HMU49568.1 methionyl-tRNA formyltransferase [Geminicoccaceae bacterium]